MLDQPPPGRVVTGVFLLVVAAVAFPPPFLLVVVTAWLPPVSVVLASVPVSLGSVTDALLSAVPVPPVSLVSGTDEGVVFPSFEQPAANSRAITADRSAIVFFMSLPPNLHIQ